MTYSDVIKTRILSLCEKRRITVNKLATLSGARQSTLEGIVKGITKNPKLKILHKISIGFGMTVSEFLNFSETDDCIFEHDI